MRILILSWRDIKNPESGGAEVVIHENAERLVKRGHKITIFAAMFSGAKENDTIRGVNIVRRGNKYTVYREAKKWYTTKGKGSFDVVIDSVNTIPFLAQKYVKDAKVVMLIHQLAREFWFYGTKFPVSLIGRCYLEDHWLQNSYRNIHTIAMSQSTKNDLVNIGFNPNSIDIISEGINFRPLKSVPKKEAKPTLVFCGRLKKTKKPVDALQAFKKIKEDMPEARLWVIGDGEQLETMKRMAQSIKDVTFFGRVNQAKRNKLLARSHVVLVPGLREGWGLIVTEANACGTPAVGYDIPGLRDSIKNNKTGLLCETNPKSMAESTLRVFGDSLLLERLSKNALKDSHNYTWDKSSQQLGKIIKRSQHDN